MGARVQGEIQAESEKEAVKILSQRGLLPLQVSVVEGSGEKKKFSGNISFSKSLNTFDQIIITRHLGTILKTGTDLLTGLQIIARDAVKPLVKKILLDIRARITAGESLSQAMRSWKDQFNPVLLNLVQAGELSGNLADVLTNYSQELRKDYAFSRKVKGAMLYPAILITALVMMVIVIIWIVIPRLKTLFSSTNIEPPIYTKIIFSVSDFWIDNVTIILPILGAFIVGGIVALRKPGTRRYIKKLLWHLPYLRTIQRNYSLLHLSKTLSTLIKAGIPLEEGLTITGRAIGGKYENILKDISEKQLSRGINLSDAMRHHPHVFPGLLVSVVATGEKSGQLDATLAQMAEFYEEEVLYSLERFLVFIEPAMIVIVGIIVGLVAGSLIAPIYRFIGAF